MTFPEQIRRIERIDRLIHIGATGSPSELADKLGLSVSQMFLTIRLMKEEFKAPIYYSKFERRYCYSKNVRFICNFIPDENISKDFFQTIKKEESRVLNWQQ